MSIYSNPNATMREIVNASIVELETKLAAIDVHLNAETNSAIDATTMMFLEQGRSALQGIRISLQNEKDRLERIIQEWARPHSS